MRGDGLLTLPVALGFDDELKAADWSRSTADSARSGSAIMVTISAGSGLAVVVVEIAR